MVNDELVEILLQSGRIILMDAHPTENKRMTSSVSA
jgi:hypothetical protein